MEKTVTLIQMPSGSTVERTTWSKDGKPVRVQWRRAPLKTKAQQEMSNQNPQHHGHSNSIRNH